jgi:hypothetical protein
MSNKRPAHRRPDTAETRFADGLSQMVGQVMAKLLADLGRDESKATAALLVERSPHSVGPARMAEALQVDAATREQMRAAYEQCLHTYRNVVRAQDIGLPFDDAVAAVAYFVAANLYALTGIDSTPLMLVRLERQLGALVHMTTRWDAAPIADRQLYFEQTAISGVLMASMAKQARSRGAEAVATLKSTARRNLHQLLGLDPDLLSLGRDGLTVATAQPAAHMN